MSQGRRSSLILWTWFRSDIIISLCISIRISRVRLLREPASWAKGAILKHRLLFGENRLLLPAITDYSLFFIDDYGITREDAADRFRVDTVTSSQLHFEAVKFCMVLFVLCKDIILAVFRNDRTHRHRDDIFSVDRAILDHFDFDSHCALGGRGAALFFLVIMPVVRMMVMSVVCVMIVPVVLTGKRQGSGKTNQDGK